MIKVEYWSVIGSLGPLSDESIANDVCRKYNLKSATLIKNPVCWVFEFKNDQDEFWFKLQHTGLLYV